jgi:uncharacterized protein (TIGR02147 family)
MQQKDSQGTRSPTAIYRYDDYRLFLKDRFESRRTDDPSYSHRKFARLAGFSNPGFLNDVIKGRRKLSADATEKMIKGFGLNPNEADFFRLLVGYGQAKRAEDKQDLYKKITGRRNRSAFSKLNPALSRYYQDYRYPLLRSAVMAMEFTGNYEDLGQFVTPPIPEAQVKKYIRDLCEWGLLRQGSDGRYEVTERFVEPPDTLREQVRQLNREWIAHALDALMKLPPDKRNMSTMLVHVSDKAAKEINDRIEKVRDDIWKLVDDDPGQASRLMQLNIQYFPRSRRKVR